MDRNEKEATININYGLEGKKINMTTELENIHYNRVRRSCPLECNNFSRCSSLNAMKLHCPIPEIVSRL